MSVTRIPGFYREDGSLRLCYIYILTVRQSGDPHVYAKIGYALSVGQRVDSLMVGSGLPAETLYCYDTNCGSRRAQQIEAALHKSFAATHARGEWFKLPMSTLADRAEFDRMRKQGLAAARVKHALWSVTDMQKYDEWRRESAVAARVAGKKKLRDIHASAIHQVMIRGKWVPLPSHMKRLPIRGPMN